MGRSRNSSASNLKFSLQTPNYSTFDAASAPRRTAATATAAAERVSMVDEEEDCPVTEKLCAAYRGLLEEKIRSITRTIQVTGMAITLIVLVGTVLLKFWRP